MLYALGTILGWIRDDLGKIRGWGRVLIHKTVWKVE